MRQFIRRYGKYYLPGFILLAVSAYFQVLTPRLLGEIIDSLNVPVAEIVSRDVYRQLGILMLVAIGAFASRFIWRYLIMGTSRYLEADLRLHLFEHLQKLPMQYYQYQKTGDLMAYAINDIGAIRQTLGPGLALSLNVLVMIFLSIGNMTTEVSPRLTAFALIPVPIILTVVIIMGRQIRIRFRRVQEAFASVSDRVQESISGLSVIKAYGQEEEESHRFEALNQRSRDANLAMTRVAASMGPSVVLLFGISFAISLVYGSHLVLQGDVSLGQFVAFNGLLTLIINPIRSVARIINMMQRGLASYKRYQNVLSVEPAIQDHPDHLTKEDLPERAAGHVQIRNLDFMFPGEDKNALSGINMDIRPGQMIGVLGRTGSGKSTLANLLLRVFDPPEGAVLLDGQDIRRLPLAYLRDQVAYAPQDNFLFSTTIEENIRFFDDRYTLEQIREASRLADFDRSAMEEFAKGYDTVVGERGVTLSGGQKQRIGLARALLRDAPLIILDDALSAVDTETERHILGMLQERLRRSTCLIIANRVSALQTCDEIIVLDDGKITQRGTHHQLLKQEGLYATIARKQSEDIAAAVTPPVEGEEGTRHD